MKLIPQFFFKDWFGICMFCLVWKSILILSVIKDYRNKTSKEVFIIFHKFVVISPSWIAFDESKLLLILLMHSEYITQKRSWWWNLCFPALLWYCDDLVFLFYFFIVSLWIGGLVVWLARKRKCWWAVSFNFIYACFQNIWKQTCFHCCMTFSLNDKWLLKLSFVLAPGNP